MKKSTGLLDKNGRVIHVNDVCRSLATYEEYLHPTSHQIKEEVDGVFTFKGRSLNEYVCGHKYTTIEIVGTV